MAIIDLTFLFNLLLKKLIYLSDCVVLDFLNEAIKFSLVIRIKLSFVAVDYSAELSRFLSEECIKLFKLFIHLGDSAFGHILYFFILEILFFLLKLMQLKPSFTTQLVIKYFFSWYAVENYKRLSKYQILLHFLYAQYN